MPVVLCRASTLADDPIHQHQKAMQPVENKRAQAMVAAAQHDIGICSVASTNVIAAAKQSSSGVALGFTLLP